MADFDLTQTDQQVQNILNDAQGAMGASAQTTLTTEYVMLKDTSGIYHKILKSSFTEAIRDVLAGLLVNNDKGTTISQIAAIASGDFGSITPDNLASVLGGVTRSSAYGSAVDANTATETGTYICNANSTNLPLSSGPWALLYVQNTNGYIRQTLYYTSSNDNEIFERTYHNNNWDNWKRIDNFGCNTAAELASLLGGTVTHITDLATPPQKRGVLLFDGTVSNAPFGSSYGSTGLFIGSEYPLCIATCVDRSGLSVFVRSANSDGSAWGVNSAWKEL